MCTRVTGLAIVLLECGIVLWALLSCRAQEDPKPAPGNVPGRDRETVIELAKERIEMFSVDQNASFQRLRQVLDINYRSVGREGVLEGAQAAVELWRTRRGEISNYETYTYSLDVIDMDLFHNGAVVFGKVVFEGTDRMSRETLGDESWITLVFQKKNSEWKIIHSHESSVGGKEKSG